MAEQKSKILQTRDIKPELCFRTQEKTPEEFK